MTARAQALHQRALRLEWFTVAWNIVEAAVAISAGVATGSLALIGFGADSLIEVTSAGMLVWRFHPVYSRALVSAETAIATGALAKRYCGYNRAVALCRQCAIDDRW